MRNRQHETKREAKRQLGETSDEYGRTVERDPQTEMTEGQDLGMTSPDIVTESPTGMGDAPTEVDRGFADDRERRD